MRPRQRASGERSISARESDRHWLRLAEVSTRCERGQHNALHIAARRNYEESCVRLLLDEAAGTDVTDNKAAVGRTLLVLAARYNCIPVAGLLLDTRSNELADVGICSLVLSTALDTASSRGHFDFCEVIHRRAEQELCRARQRLAFAQHMLLSFDILGEIVYQLPDHAVVVRAGLTQARPHRTQIHEANPPLGRKSRRGTGCCWDPRASAKNLR